MRVLLTVILYVVAVVVGAYSVLRFFSEITSVDMFVAMSWGFGAERYELVVTSCIFYLFLVLSILAFLRKPYHILNMWLTHDGALRGYPEDGGCARLFDPVQMQYVSRRISLPPPAAERFDRVFDVVASYRLFLSDCSLNVKALNLWSSLMLILVAGLALCLLSGVMWALGNAYTDALGLGKQVSFGAFLSRIQAVLWQPHRMLLQSFVLLIFLSSFLGSVLASRITRGYEEKFAAVQRSLRDQVKAKVGAGQVVRGKPIKRMFNYKKMYEGTVGVRFTTDQDYRRTITTTTYTFAFDGLVDETQVYLGITYEDGGENSSTIDHLERYFEPRGSSWYNMALPFKKMMEPIRDGSLKFLVNDDYSLTLVPEEGE